MDLDQARQELGGILGGTAGAPPGSDRLNAARQWLIARGTEAVPTAPVHALALADLIRHASAAPASPARRTFAVLIAEALAVPGLLSIGPSPARLERDICALLESALPHALVRAGYPFGADLDLRRRHLAALATSIWDCLQPLEPSFPAWLNGRSPR